MREWFKRQSWKDCVPQGTESSNLSLSAVNKVNEEGEHANCFACVRDENGGAMFRQQTKPRAGAQTNFCDGKNLVEGDSLPLRNLKTL